MEELRVLKKTLFFFICALFESDAWLQRGPLDRAVAVLWVAKMRSSGPHSFQTRETSCKTMKNVKHQNSENLKTYISYNNLFELIEVMEHGCFQGKHKFHNFDKLIYMCYNCYNYHNLLITSASTNAQYSRTFLTEGIKFWWLRLATIGYLRSGLYWRCHVRMGPRYYRTFSREQFTTKLQARTKQPQ